MDITQRFYDSLASQYDKLFLDWKATTREQAMILDRIFRNNGFDHTAGVLDCACGIGTQAIGLAAMGYDITASDISEGALAEARGRAAKNNVHVAKSKSGIVVKGLYDMAVHFSKCCSPVPGDEIVGFVTRGRGMSIHRTDCINMLNLSDAERYLSPKNSCKYNIRKKKAKYFFF